MSLDFGVNWLAILAGTLAHMLIGAAWFGGFARPWMALAHPGRTKEDLDAGPKWIYGIAAGGGLVTAIILAAVLETANALDLLNALVVTFLLWVGFTLVKYATTYAFEYRPTKLLLIDAGYALASMLAMAIIYAVWP